MWCRLFWLLCCSFAKWASVVWLFCFVCLLVTYSGMLHDNTIVFALWKQDIYIFWYNNPALLPSLDSLFNLNLIDCCIWLLHCVVVFINCRDWIRTNGSICLWWIVQCWQGGHGLPHLFCYFSLEHNSPSHTLNNWWII